MKRLLRNILVHTVILYYLVQAIPGVDLDNTLQAVVGGGAILALLFTFIRPVLKILFLPINLITLGLFSGLVNVLILYLFDRYYSAFSVSSWDFAGYSFDGFVIPAIDLNVFWTYVLISLIITFVSSFLNWLCS
ncbi:phage holin family protein [Candidatus Microgenomates bacterium]|nr:phage holin family protein [Candidatus Microgenomates bacterium]